MLAEQKAYAERKKRGRTEAERKSRKPTSKTVPATEEVKKEGQDGKHTGGAKEAPHSSSGPRLRNKDSSQESGQAKKERLHRPESKASSDSSNKDGEDASPTSYHHIPQVAASQFTRTTTVESLTEKALVHKLSKKAMKFHMDGPNASRAMAETFDGMAPNEKTKALLRAQALRERQYERNQFQHTPTLTATEEVDEKASRLTQRHTFQAHLKPIDHENDSSKEARRRSTGSMLGKMAPATQEPAPMHPGIALSDTQSSCDHCEVAADPNEHRVDWTQSDEAANLAKPTSPPQLRKPESKWTLRGRLGGFNKHAKDDKVNKPVPLSGLNELEAAAELSRSPKIGGFFARFKR